MSCIPKLLALKGDKPFLEVQDYPGIVVEHGGQHKGYDYLITLTDMGIRCGYVALSPDHPLYKKDFYEEDSELDCHGGITFYDQHGFVKKLIETPCEDKWIGFDAGHAGDKFDLDTALKAFTKNDSLRRIKSLQDTKNQLLSGIERDWETIKDVSYMETCCKHLIEQLIEKAA